MHTLLYSEKQHMVGGLIIVAFIIVMLLFVIFKWKRNARLGRVLSVVALAIGSIIVMVLATLRLETRYYTDTVEYQFGSIYMAPFEVVNVDTIAGASIITYNPIDYGGWGMKGNADTRVYNASGKKGILFTFKNGKKLLLGTQHPDSLKTALTGHYPMVQ